MKLKSSVITAGFLMATLMATSPLALADRHGNQEKQGKWDNQEMCEKYRNGEGPFNHEKQRSEMAQRHAEIADRLKLDEEQREIWDDIHAERAEMLEQRMDRWEKKMDRRCPEKGREKGKENGKNRD